ncbi:MAG: glycosyltransferase, partial [Ktedonobacteraceae bacterium]|nr:glycosyltransferase [Ktedonobacteraceae bacterium]
MGTATQRTILFLIADTGAGHRSAANAISHAINIIAEREQEEWQAQHAASGMEDEIAPPPPAYRLEIVDVFEEYSRFPLREAVKLYGPTIRYNPKLYGQFFHSTNREGVVVSVNTLAAPLVLNGLLRLFTTVQPDIIVSIHPMVNFVTVRALRKLGMKVPFLTVVTDLVSVHYSWYSPGVDGYIVPTEEAKRIYLQRGLDPRKVHVLGMPIDPRFSLPVASKEELRAKFDLLPGLPVVLLVGGGDGAGGLRTAVRAISEARLPIQLMVVTGRNRRLYANLQSTRSRLHVPAKIFGFVNNMPELMHAADVIVTKAGPGTICEALACNLPVVLSGYVPGQEEGNVAYVVKNGAGVLAPDPISLVDALRRLIVPGSAELRLFTEKATLLSQPMASFEIAKCIQNYMESGIERYGRQAGQWQYRQRKLAVRLRAAIRFRRSRL